RLPLNTKNQAQSESGSFAPAFAMKLRAVRSQFEHFTCHENLSLETLDSAQEADHFRESAGIGVVGIIDHDEAFAELDHFASHLLRLHLADSLPHVIP